MNKSKVSVLIWQTDPIMATLAIGWSCAILATLTIMIASPDFGVIDADYCMRDNLAATGSSC